jgi:signal peptidase I
LIRTFIITPVIVVGESMVPTLKEKQILLLNKLDYKFNEIERYDIVVIKVGNGEIIKRVIGLPGENIEYKDNNLYINDQKEETIYNFDTEDFELEDICNCNKIPKDKYLVLGDNREVSSDSRGPIGLIDIDDIKGSTKISIWPIKIVK